MAHRLVVGVFLCLLSLVSAASQGQTVAFVDAQGALATTLLDGDTVRVRVVDPGENTGPSRDSVAVTVTSDLAADSQPLTLLETGPDTGVFEGVVKLYPAGSTPPATSPKLATATSSGATPSRDTLRASYPANGATASAGLVGSILQLVDEWGRESAELVPGQPVRLRVRDQLRNQPMSRDSFQVRVASMFGVDATVTVEETAVNSAVFEGVLATHPASGSGAGLPVQVPDLITATLAAADGVTTSGAQAQVAGSQVVLLNTGGEPVESYLEGERIRVRVTDPSALTYSVGVQVAAALTGDSETLTLIQVAGATFEGEIATRLLYYGSPTPEDGILQITETYESATDTVTVSYAEGPGAPSASASFITGRIAFVDAEGEVTSSYAEGTEIHIRLESPAASTQYLDTVFVDLHNLSLGVGTTLELLETRRDSGVFTGSISPVNSPFSARAGDQIRVRYTLYSAELSPEALAEISARSFWFLDEWGEPTDEIVENSPARVRMFSSSNNSNPWNAESATVEMRVRLTGDLEPLTLTETGADTDVFEGSIPMETATYSQPDGTLQTANGGQPDYHQDEVMARSGEVEATARTVGARIDFVDALGRRVDHYVLGEPVRIRIVDPHQPPGYTFTVIITSQETGDVEWITMQRTAPGSNVFMGSIATLVDESQVNDKLGVAPGGQVQVRHTTGFSPIEITRSAEIRGSAVRFVDAAGQPAAVYLESSRAYVRVLSAASNIGPLAAEAVQVQMRADLTQDWETLTLIETGPDTGVFEGSIKLQLASGHHPQQTGNGVLETTETSASYGSPHRFDTLKATFIDGMRMVEAEAGLTGSRVWFADAAGAEVLEYPIGGRAYVRVEDHNANSPQAIDFMYVDVRSVVTSDQELLQLTETGPDTAIFAGSLPLPPAGGPAFNDGALQVQPAEPIEVYHQDFYGTTASSAVALIKDSSVEIIDEQGEPTDTLLQGDQVRVRVFSHFGNSNPGQVEGVTVQLQSLYGEDSETLELTETGPNTGVFEGAMPLYTDGGYGTPAMGLRTSYGPYPERLEDRVTVTHAQSSDEARVIGARIVFLDSFGRVTATYAAGETVRVRVEDHARNSSPTSHDTAYIDLRSSTGDNESFQLQETGYDTAVFEGAMPTVLSGGATFNGQLLVAGGGTVEVEIYPYGAGSSITTQAAITGNAVRFVDAAGQPATVYLEGSRAFLRVISAAGNTSGSTIQTVSVQVTSELTGDIESVTLTETGLGTAVFEGSIPLVLENAAFSGDGTLQTYEQSGPPHRFDTIQATYQDWMATSVARIGLTGSRTWFVDAAGNEALSYPAGGTVRVRIEAPSRNNAWQYDFTNVRVRSLVNNDVEVVQLQETARDSGIFTGALPTSLDYDAVAIAGLLRVQPGEQIEAEHEDLLGFTASSAIADIEDRSIEIVDDETGISGVLLERGRARVRVFSVFDNSNPGQAESVAVQLSSQFGSDVETLTLTETGPDTDLFEGTLPLDNDFNGNLPESLRTSHGPYPERLEDRVTASFGPVSAEARVVGSSIVFLDSYGRETATYAAGESVRVRVIDHNRNSSTTSFDSAYVDLSASTGDNESFQIQETGYNTPVFEGTMLTVLSGGATFSGQLLVVPGGTVTAGIYPYGGNGPITVQAAITGNAVRFVDAAGQPATSYLESSRAYLQVTSITRNTSSSTVETVTLQLGTELGSDSELVTLTETGTNTGIFRGSIPLRLAPSTSPGDGVLQTHQIGGPPHEYDTLRATYSDPSGTSVARIGLTGSRVWFVDATGAEVSSYPVGGTVRVRVEDQNLNTPGQWDFLPVRVRSLTTLDEEIVQLQETSRDSGVFAGSLPLAATGPPSVGDSRLLAQAGERIEGVYDEMILQSTATAVIDDLAIQFIDAAGELTDTLLTKGTARVRVFSIFASSTLDVELRSVHGSDVETLTLTETGAGTHVFEGTLPLDTDFNGNLTGSLRTSYGPYPENLEDRVTASFGPVSAEARVVGSSIVFLDAYGRETSSYAAGETVRVRVVDHNRNSSDTSVDTAHIELVSSTQDDESLEVQETGYDTSVFEGTIPTLLSGGAITNGQLLVAPGGWIKANIYPYGANGSILVQAAITGNAVRFVDASGQAASSYLESSRAYLEVTSATSNTSSTTVQMVTVQLNNELGADSELVTLTETGANTGIFRGSIALRLVVSSPTPGDNVLQTYQISGPPHEYDTLRATYGDPSGTSVARIGLTGSRVWFVDATGAEVSSYPVGGTVRVRVEDQNRNTPGQWDFLPARVRSLTTLDEEIVQLQETSRDSGIFAGSLPLAATGPQSVGDGRLLAQAGERIEGVYDEMILQSTATAVIDDLAILFVDAAGEPTDSLLAKGAARVRVFSIFASSTLDVELRSVYGSDVETLTLTETGPGTHVFEGVLPLDDDLNSDLPASLRTTYGPHPERLEDRVTASFGAVSAEARVAGSSIVFLDAYGRETTAYAAGETVRVRVVDHNRNTSTTSVDSAYVDLTASTGDNESFELQETGADTSVFEGSMPAVLSGGVATNSQLLVAPGGTVEAQVYPYGASGFIAVQAAITGNAVLFVDAAGQPASSYLESSRAYLRVISATANSNPSAVETVSVQLNNELGADNELVTLTETGASTGVFEGSIAMRMGSTSTPGDGVLQTHQIFGPPHELDTLRATYSDPSGTSVAQIGLTGSRLWFVDAAGVEALSFAANATVRVRVEDHNYNHPGIVNQIPARVRSLTTLDEEVVMLTETGTDTGLFAGSLRLSVSAAAALGDGYLRVQPGEQIEGEHEDASGFTSSFSVADVTEEGIPENQAPTPIADTATTAEDEAVTVSVLANDTDPDQDVLDVVAITQPATGTAVLEADDTVTYTPPTNASGEAVFSYTVRDPGGLEATATVTITITPVNDAPVANADTATVAEDGSVSISVLGNDTDAENDTLDVTAVTQGTNGTVVINADETITYTPAANFSGTDTFTYTISDGNGGTATATVTVTVTPVNDAPLALADGASVAEDGSVNVAVLGNDSDLDNDPLDVTAVTQGVRGTVTLNADDTVTYAPGTNFAGTDTFTYTISDGNGGTATATVTVSVIGDNDAPAASPDSATVAEDGSVSIAVLTNDSDPDDDALDVTAVTQGAHGTVTIEADNTITYEPAADYHGTDSFTYTISDGNGGTALAVVSLTVTPVNDDPVAANDEASGSEDGTVAIAVLGNDSDADDDPLTIASVTQGANGSVTIQGTAPDQTVLYTPNANFNGIDSFTYTIGDGNGGTASATVTVSIGSENDSPVAVADSVSVGEDGTVVVTVLDNDTDPENDALDVLSVTLGANGMAVVNADETVTYTPDANFHGTDSFTYTIEDGNGGTANTTVTVTVTSVNDLPVANGDAGSVAEDSSVSIAVLTNDDDADGDALSVTAVTQGANGSVSINPDKTITYAPNPNFQGSDVFTYTVSDGNGGTATASVAITVISVNDAPVANPNSATTPEDNPVVIAVLADDTDADGDTLQVASVTQGTKGTVAINPDRTVTYTPNADVSGGDSFTYTVSDGNGGTATAAVTLTITAVNDAPVAVNDTASTTAEVLVNVTVLGNDVDVDGPSLTVTGVTQPAHGTTVVNANQTIRYTPASGYKGSDAFTYTVADGAGGTATATVTMTVNAPPRVTGNLQVLYNLNEGSGSTVTDTSGTGTPLNLTVSNPAAVSWISGGLSVNSATLIQSAGAATKVITACQASNAITIEAWVAPDNTSQTGPAPLVSISQQSNKRNVTFGQSGSRWDGRLRTTNTNQMGNTTQTAVGTVSTALSHVVYTRDSAGNIRIYVDGVQSTSSTLTGNFSGWVTSYKLGLVNELSTGSPWLGDLYLVAIYSRALSATEVRQNWLAGE